MRWLLVATVVCATTAGDLLQSWEMKKQGAAGRFRPTWPLGAAVVFMAISFFAFLKLLEREDLSFAVPATAASLVLETILARLVLGEQVERRRWAGALMVACGVVLLGRS
jgi:drug/metabolite transporter (DMT)-like permease